MCPTEREPYEAYDPALGEWVVLPWRGPAADADEDNDGEFHGTADEIYEEN
jgi:hypothetical protein